MHNIKKFNFDELPFSNKYLSFLIIGNDETNKERIIYDIIQRNNKKSMMLISDKKIYEINNLNTSVCNIKSGILEKLKEEPFNDLTLIFNDCLKCTNDVIEYILDNGKHHKISNIVSTTNVKLFKGRRDLNITFDCVIIFSYEQYKQYIYGNYFGMFHTYKLFKEVHDKYTQGGGCIICYNGNKVYWYNFD